MEIVGFNHDDLTSGGKAAYTFGMKNLMSELRKMNGSNTNKGGFLSTLMCSWLNNDIYNIMDETLKTVIKPVNKRTSVGDGGGSIQTNSMNIFLFSEIEVFGSRKYSEDGEGNQYSGFVNTLNRIKHTNNGTGDVSAWWLRSPVIGEDYNFCAVYIHGENSNYGAITLTGVCFGFCV